MLNLLTRLRKPKPTGYVYRIWEHTGWGNSMHFSDWERRRLIGWLFRIPEVGDEVQCKMATGKTARFLVTKVERCGDPHDMFFADVKDIGYVDSKKEKVE